MPFPSAFRRVLPAGRPLAVALAIALTAGAPGGPVQAQTQTQQAPQGQGQAPAAVPFGDWVQYCVPNPPPPMSPPKEGEQNACLITQRYTDPKSQHPVLQVTIGYFGNNRDTGAALFMPLGVPLLHGVQVSVDGTPVASVPFRVCHPREGCVAYVPLTDKVVNAFKAGKQAVVSVRLDQGGAVNYPVSLNGFTAGFGKIK